MNKRITIQFEIKNNQYKDYEYILDDFLNSLENAYIYNAEVREFELDEIQSQNL